MKRGVSDQVKQAGSIATSTGFLCQTARLTAAEVDAQAAEDIGRLVSQLAGRIVALSIEDLQKSAELNSIFCARLAIGRPTIIGMACLVPMHLPQGLRLWVETVVVHENYRRQGIATAIMTAVLAEAATMGAEHVSLTCNQSRAEAHAFYDEAGFNRVPTTVFRRSTMKEDESRLN